MLQQLSREEVKEFLSLEGKERSSKVGITKEHYLNYDMLLEKTFYTLMV